MTRNKSSALNHAWPEKRLSDLHPNPLIGESKMAVLSIKEFPDDVMHALKLAALNNRQTLRDYVTEQLTILAKKAHK
jgi:porphobilinogen deaminase